MALATFSDLSSALTSYLATTDYLGQYENWGYLVEAEVNRGMALPNGEMAMLRTRHQEQVTTLTATAGQAYIDVATALPGFLEFRFVELATDPPRELAIESPQQYARFRFNESGVPGFFHLRDGRLYLRKTPDSAYTLNVSYYKAIDHLSASQDNWLMTNYPDVYLFGCLREAAYLMRTDEFPVALWAGRYVEAFKAVAAADKQARWSGAVPTIRLDTAVP